MEQAARFEGFPAEAFAWFEGLLADNTREYMQSTRATYEGAVRGPLGAMLGELAGEFGGEVKLFRQNRDVRFSPDKSPYKTTCYGILHSRPGSEAACYAELSADGLFAASGYYQPARDQLDRYRAAVDDERRGSELAALVEQADAAGLELYGETLRTAPRGFSRTHPRIRLLRHTGLIAARGRPGEGGIDRDEALALVAGTWRDAAPLVAWLDAHVGASSVPPEERYGRGRSRG